MVYHYQTGPVLSIARKYKKQLIVAVAAIFMATMAVMGLSARAAAPNWTANAGSTIDFSCGGSYVHTLDTVVPGSGGNFTGTGYYNPDPSYTWDITGNISGDTFTFSILYTGTSAGSVYNATAGVINPDGSASATVDSNCQSLTMSAGSFSALVQPPTVAACEPTTSVVTTSLSTWDLSQTRANGHNEIIAEGLHVWTDGSTDTGPRTDGVVGTWNTDKAAAYYVTDFPLSGLGNLTIVQSIDYTATLGITPGLQLVVDFDNNGTPDGILVGEAVYGNNWWLSNGSAQFVKDNAPNTGGGNGSDWFGTPNEWLSKFPNAQVKAIGYSLGSGVHGDGILNRISLGCVNYTFDLPPTYTVTVNKYVDGVQATATSVNNAAFPMIATWVTTIPPLSNTGNYELDADGFNGIPVPYQAITAEMNQGANYTTNEITGGAVVSATCNGTAPFALVGYTTGDTLAAAQAGTPSTTIPAFTNLQGNKYVIVWNKTCRYVTKQDDCKNSGWMLGLADGSTFRNQGDCVSYFATKTKNPPTNGATNEKANKNR